jgi:thiol:disulfide interchange protein DsbA
MKHSITVALLIVALSACAREVPAPAATAAPTTAASTAGGAAGVTPPAAATDTQQKLDAAAAAQEGADTGATADKSEAALERIAALPAEGQLPTGKWVAGKNYQPLVPAQPTNVAPGKVEVVEVFWYGCPHCYALDPYLESWRKNKPSYVEFTRIPVMWGAVHRAHAKLFYTLEALGKLDELHGKVFAEIHENHNPLYGNTDAETQKMQVAFAKANGISESDFLKAYNSFGVQTNLQKADDLGRRYKIEGVPTVVIDGKYETDVGMAGSQANLIQLINDLAASEKHK